MLVIKVSDQTACSFKMTKACLVFIFFFSYGGGSFSFGQLISGVTKRFSTEFEYKQVQFL